MDVQSIIACAVSSINGILQIVNACVPVEDYEELKQQVKDEIDRVLSAQAHDEAIENAMLRIGK